MLKNLSIAKKLYLGFGIIITILIGLSVITYTNLGKFNQANDMNIHTYKVINGFDNILENMVNMETGQRGFSLTGDEKFLDPYNEGKTDFLTHLDEVKGLTSDNPKQQENVRKILEAEKLWLQIAEKSISLRREGKTEEVVSFEKAAQGKTSMDIIRTIISSGSALEESLLDQRTTTSNALKNTTNYLLIFGTLVGLLLAVFLAFVITRNIIQGILKVKMAADSLAVGDTNVNLDVNSKDEIGLLMQSFAKMIANIQNVNTEVSKLIVASNDGNLSERGNVEAFQGDWAIMIKGLNGLIDAIVEPVQEAQAVLEEMAKGNLQISVKGNYQGDHAKIKDALNDTTRTLFSYVNEISKVLTEMANGNLNVEIANDYRGDFAEIKNSLNNIIKSLNEVLSDMNNASAQVASGSRQVSDSAQALSQGSTEQASSIEQLTASMEEISTQTRLNATNATQANELALAAKEGAVKGNDQMKGMLKAMDDINEGSSNIFKIIKVIDEIAFQTNILALNAAVEAARAGQHGKGFAVVAEEVRNLAARSANAAKETTGLIEGSMKKVEGGTKIANDTAVALSQIVEGVTKVTNLVGEIANASNEQALGINQVNQGILQVSSVVQTNSATSEESAAASEELSSQAELLREQVSRFKLKKSTGSSYRGFDDLNPEVLRMLEEMSNKKSTLTHYSNQGYAEAAATSSKPKISLSNNDSSAESI